MLVGKLVKSVLLSERGAVYGSGRWCMRVAVVYWAEMDAVFLILASCFCYALLPFSSSTAFATIVV